MTVYAMYKDDLILKDPKKSEIYQIIKEMHEANLDIIIESDLQDFPGVNTKRKSHGTIHLTQPRLIDQILKYLILEDKNVTIKLIPASLSKLLLRKSELEAFDGSFDQK